MKGTEQQLIQHFNQYGKTDSWLNLANQFNILPQGTNKQKSDKARRLFNSNVSSKWNSGVGTTNNSYYGAVGISEIPRWRSGTTASAVTVNPYTIDTFKPINIRDLSAVQPNHVWGTDSTGKPAWIDYPVGTEYQEFLKWKEEKNRFQQPTKKSLPQPYLNGDPNNVLVIPDLHLPFELDGALEFCRNQQERFNCGTVVFIGDIIDNHAQSFHDTDTEGLSIVEELNLAIEKLQDWYQVFPQATITLGNHDRIVARKLFSVGISKRWMRPLGEVLNTPNWNYVEEFIHNDVLYVHGEGGTALKKAQNEMISTVQGHSHTEGYVQLLPGIGGNRFAMQVGTLINFDSYAFAYAQRGKRPVLSCGVVLNNHPILIPYGN